MASIKGTETEKNVLKAFAGESQARNRYTYFAGKAAKEGFVQISALYEEIADQERNHAKNFFRFLEGGEVEISASFPAGKIGSTAENLEASIAGEHQEWSNLYPEFAEIAEKEGFREISVKFKSIAVAEKAHEKQLAACLKNINENRVFEKNEPVIWQCRKCGYTSEGKKAPKTCAACQHPQSYFEIQKSNW